MPVAQMHQIYGSDFARIYSEKWAFFDLMMWPFVSRVVREEHPKARRWLDLCCGTGTLLRYVCDAEYEAVGVDRSIHQLRHAQECVPQAKLVRADMRDLVLARKFDVITCLFDSLNYLLSEKELQRVFRRVRRHLAPEGIFLFDMNVFERHRRLQQGNEILKGEGWLVVIEPSFDEARCISRLRVTGFVREGKRYRRFEEVHVQRDYHPREIEEALSQAGFSWWKRDARSLDEPTEASSRLVYVCKDG